MSVTTPGPAQRVVYNVPIVSQSLLRLYVCTCALGSLIKTQTPANLRLKTQISDSDPPSPEIPPLSDDSHPSLNRSRSLESLERSPWQDLPNSARPDLDDIPSTHRGQRSPRGYHWESTGPNGSSSFQVSVTSFGGGPVTFGTRSFRDGGRNGDPTMTAVNQDFENLVGTIMGLNPNNRRNRPTIGVVQPGFDHRPWRHDPPQEMNNGLFGCVSSRTSLYLCGNI